MAAAGGSVLSSTAAPAATPLRCPAPAPEPRGGECGRLLAYAKAEPGGVAAVWMSCPRCHTRSVFVIEATS